MFYLSDNIMFRAKIKLVYRQEISQRSECAFERAVFRVSYQEFLHCSYDYSHNGKLKTFSRMREYDSRAGTLHDKLNLAVMHFIARLDNKIPHIKDNLGNKISFETPRFELIESHTEDMSVHHAAIYYETAPLTLIDFMGEYMLLSQGNKAENEQAGTFVVRLQPNLSIMSYQGIAHPQMAWIASQQ